MGMVSHYFIKKILFNGIYIIFQGIQLFLKLLYHAFHFLFKPSPKFESSRGSWQGDSSNFLPLEYIGDIERGSQSRIFAYYIM